jgi:hypothetical protein
MEYAKWISVSRKLTFHHYRLASFLCCIWHFTSQRNLNEIAKHAKLDLSQHYFPYFLMLIAYNTPAFYQYMRNWMDYCNENHKHSYHVCDLNMELSKLLLQIQGDLLGGGLKLIVINHTIILTNTYLGRCWDSRVMQGTEICLPLPRETGRQNTPCLRILQLTWQKGFPPSHK